MSERDLKTIEKMEDLGGSFVKALGNAARYADPINLAKIKAAFREYWETYQNAAKRELDAKEAE